MAQGRTDTKVATRGRKRLEKGYAAKAKREESSLKTSIVNPDITTAKIDHGTVRTYWRDRPLYSDPEEFERIINEYFDYCESTFITKQVPHSKGITLVKTPIPPTMAGLARFLGISRETLNSYKVTDSPLAETNPDAAKRISDLIYLARERIHEHNVTMALLGCHDSKIAELNLVNNFGYSRRPELEDALDGLQINVNFTTERTIKKMEDLESQNAELQRKIAALEGKGLKIIEAPKENKDV